MEELTLNFFGEEAKITIQKDLPSLRLKISEKYLLSTSDVSEIILYYIKDNQKIYIINGEDFSKFKESKINIIYLDINQNSRLYLDNVSKLQNEKSENQKDEQELNELLQKYEVFSKKKKEKEIFYYKKTNEIMNEIKNRRNQLIKEQHKEFSKIYDEDEEYIKKIYNLQRKLNLPTTVRIPKEIKKQEQERIYKEEKRKQEEIRKQAKIRKEEELKKKAERRRKYEEEIKKLKEEDDKKKEIARFNYLKSTQKNINSRQEFFPHISLRKMEEEKRKAANRCRIIAASTAAIFSKAIKKEKEDNDNNKEELKISNDILKEENNKKNDNRPNTVPVFNKVNEILNKTVEQVKQVAIEHIKKERDSTKTEDLKEKEKEKKEQIEKIKKITKEAVKEINNLTKLVIDQSNALIEKINNPELSNLSSNDDDVILKAPKKDLVKKKEGIHFNVSCDGCKMNPIRGNRYKCKKCLNFDFCQNCYEKDKENHGHEFTKIEKPKNTKRMGHKKKDYCGRGIVHRGVRCEGCGLEPLVGWRFKCSICDDYNLCENCEESIGCKHSHPLIKIYYSSMLKDFDDYYLKLNNYENKEIK